MRIHSLLHFELPVVTQSTTVSEAMIWMRDFSMHHLPMVDNGVLKGVVTYSTLLSFSPDELVFEKLNKTEIKNYPKLTHQDHVYSVLEKFAKFGVDIIPVVGLKNKYVGSVTLTSMTRVMTQMLGLSEMGTGLEIELSMSTYSVADLIKIIEENETRILSMVQIPIISDDHSRVRLGIRVNIQDVSRLQNVLSRAGYTVYTSDKDEDKNNEEMKERAKELLKFIEL